MPGVAGPLPPQRFECAFASKAFVWRVAGPDLEVDAVGESGLVLLGHPASAWEGARPFPPAALAAPGDGPAFAPPQGGLPLAPQFHVLRTAAGQLRWFRSQLLSVSSADGRGLGITFDVTEQLRAAQALGPGVDAALLELLPTAVWTAGPDLAPDLSGEALGAGADLDAAGGRDRYREAQRRALRDPIAFVDHWSGTPVQLKLEPLRTPSGEVVGCAALALEEAQEGQRGTAAAARRSIRERDEILRAIFAASPLAIVAFAPDTTVMMWNPAAEAMFGWRDVEVLGRPYPAIPDEEQGRYRQFLARTLSGEAGMVEGPRRRKDGSLVLCRVQGAPIYGPDGRARGVMGVIADITDRQRAEDALSRSEQTLRAIFNGIADSIFIHGVDGTILDVNETMLAMYGVDRERAARLSIAEDYSGPDNPIQRLPAMWERVLGGQQLTFEWQAKRPDDGALFPVEVVLKRIRLPERDVILATVRDIGARKTTERQLEHSLSRLQATLESTADGILVTGFDGEWLNYNRRFLDLWGLTEEQVKTTGVGDVVAHLLSRLKDPRALGDKLGRLRVDTEVVFDDLVELADGRVFEAHTQPQRLGGKSIGRVWRMHEITERKRAEEALLAAKERYERLVHAIEGIVWEADPNTLRFTFVSAQAERMLGYPLRLWTEDPDFWVGHMHPDDRRWAPQFCAGETAAGRPHEFEYRMITSAGKVIWLRDLSNIVIDQGRPVLRGIMVDITARKQAEKERDRLLVKEQAARAAAERARRRAAFLAEVGQRMASTLDAREALRFAVKGAVPLLGEAVAAHLFEGGEAPLVARSPEEGRFVGAPELLEPGPAVRSGEVERLDRLSEREEGEPLHRRRAELARRGAASLLCVPLLLRGQAVGALTFLSGRPGRYSAADVELAQELAQRAALAVDNARLYRESQEAVRARDEFLSVASHELRTPSTSLLLAVEGLLRAGRKAPGAALPPALLASSLSTAERQIKHLSRLVDRLLDVSRAAVGGLQLEPEELELGELVRRAVSNLAEDFRLSGSEVTVAIPGAVRGWWDRARLEQVITNLLGNALKYGGGKPIAVRVESAPGLARVTVADHGIGIPLERQQEIFGRFQRAVSGRHYGGLGLGLYIVSQIVSASGGRIRVESTPGVGSTFVVELPLHPGAHPEPVHP